MQGNGSEEPEQQDAEMDMDEETTEAMLKLQEGDDGENNRIQQSEGAEPNTAQILRPTQQVGKERVASDTHTHTVNQAQPNVNNQIPQNGCERPSTAQMQTQTAEPSATQAQDRHAEPNTAQVQDGPSTPPRPPPDPDTSSPFSPETRAAIRRGKQRADPEPKEEEEEEEEDISSNSEEGMREAQISMDEELARRMQEAEYGGSLAPSNQGHIRFYPPN
ncbi:hypothetical protein DACRYDRAFT_108056 [Dacryopinax primogenitus]|uniref:Uncharacterized protein n=1 Tax=Dacryopinax primogenitus (strain DJM 731) TaxID=1858805 RepID=M5G6Q8_DACPD|nr:uncharacterized protein DACRYDRAFT_108056 [Dacryopinax primogenitus]EJU01507.1 hypothetical protein DACRYDRAFT_108056 [Dacryopinax primogenitus]